jgi:very-short-patch-repair endonuclease
MLLTKTQLHARALRNNLTDAEQKLWQKLRAQQLDVKFRRQHPIAQYVVDFVFLQEKLIIEPDGGQHAAQLMYDRERTVLLESLGYRVLRFWNNEVFENFDGVLASISEALHPTPALPASGEGVEQRSLT